MCKCKQSDCFECTFRKAVKDLPKLPKQKKVKKKKAQPPEKCGICRRRLIIGEYNELCMACRCRVDNC